MSRRGLKRVARGLNRALRMRDPDVTVVRFPLESEGSWLAVPSRETLGKLLRAGTHEDIAEFLHSYPTQEEAEAAADAIRRALQCAALTRIAGKRRT